MLFVDNVSGTHNASELLPCHNRNMAIQIHHKGRRDAHVFLAEWLVEKGKTAEQLAALMNVSKGTISKLMNNKQRYTIPLLQQIAFVLDCEVHQLLRPPSAPTRDELLANATPAELRSALELIETARKTGTSR